MHRIIFQSTKIEMASHFIFVNHKCVLRLNENEILSLLSLKPVIEEMIAYLSKVKPETLV